MTKLQDSQAGSASHTRELRQHPRRKLAGMAYVELTQDNGGILLNLSEGGLAIQSALPLNSKEFPDLRFQLPNMRGWLTGSGRAVWISESKKEAGIQFLDLHEHARAQIRMWVAKEGMDEPEIPASAGLGASGASPIGAGAGSDEPANGVHTTAGTRIAAQERSAPPATQAPPVRDDQSFRFHDYSMFAGDVNAGPWIEPVKQRRSWGTYVLFTLLLAALFFVLGAMIGRDNLNGLVKKVEGEPPPSAKAPSPPELSQSNTPLDSEAKSSNSASSDAMPSSNSQTAAREQASAGSGQTAATGENPAQAANVTPEQNGPASTANDQPSGGAGAAAARPAATPSDTAEPAPPAKTESGSQPPSASRPKERSANASKGGTLPRRDASYATRDVADSNEYGRSILVNAPAPGSPPFFVNLPGEPVSASSSVAISARRSIQVPPRADAGGYGSERLIIGKLLAHSDPFYPAEAEAKRIEGIVELHALVGRSGQVISVTPVSGPGVLVAAGATALHEWRYEPTFINGDPVETHVDVTMVFRSR